MNLYDFLDCNYGVDGDSQLKQMLAGGAKIDECFGDAGETPLHVATRRRRLSAVQILLDHGAAIDAKTAGGKTAHAHAVRRKFDDVANLLLENGASVELNAADRLAVAVVNGQLDQARAIIAEEPNAAKTGNPEEDRLLADVAGRNSIEPLQLLIDAGTDLATVGLDGGTALHQSAWFGQPANARILIAAGAPLDVFDSTHFSSPLGWAVHGARYAGGADEAQTAYVELVKMLLEAGSSLVYPENSPATECTYWQRLLKDATPAIAEVLNAIHQE